VLASTLPPEINAEVLVKSPVVRLKEIFQPLPSHRGHPLHVPSFVASPGVSRGPGLPVWQVKEF
jgi:hypothetical protein